MTGLTVVRQKMEVQMMSADLQETVGSDIECEVDNFLDAGDLSEKARRRFAEHLQRRMKVEYPKADSHWVNCAVVDRLEQAMLDLEI